MRNSVPPDQLPDLREQVPDLIQYLFKGERVVSVRDVPSITPRKIPSSLAEMHRLVGAEFGESIGDTGPALAALPLEEGQAPELRLYEALFGRDSLRVAADLQPYYPKLTRATLVKLAELQGVAVNSAREEEPGRIIHEARNPATDPIARQLTKERGWDWPYYGSVDATLDFIRTAAAYCRHPEAGIDLLSQTYTGRDEATHTIAEALIRATNWTLGKMDANPEGLVEYHSPLPKGIENEVWKDSWDAYFHADGTIANHADGIAAIEVQSRAYDALLDMAEMHEQLSQPEEAASLRERAKRLCTVVMDKFWTDERGGFFALGSDRDEHHAVRPMWVMSSNMGHLLNSRLLANNDPDIQIKRESIIRNLFSPDMLNAGGIRTVATHEQRFRPGAYHNGSVWLWDTAYIARGLRRCGYAALATNLEQRIINVTHQTGEFPEYVRGDDSPRVSLSTRVIDLWDQNYHKLNRVEQPPQQVQAWSVSAALAIKNDRHRPHKNEPSHFEQQILDSLQES